MITLPAFRSITRVEDLGLRLEDDSYMGTPGWIFETETDSVCFGYELEGHPGQCVVPIGRDEFSYSSAEAASHDKDLLEFAIGEGMFPSFKQQIGERIREDLEKMAVEVMADRASGDIAPEQVARQDVYISHLADIMVAVWLQNPAK